MPRFLIPPLCSLLAATLAAQGQSSDAGAGKEHEVLHRLTGRWSFTIQDHINGTAAEPLVMSGIQECRKVCGGKWIVDEVRFADTPYNGIAFSGWDATQRKYVSVWVDSQYANYATSTGSYDEEKRELTFRSKTPTADGERDLRMVVSWPSDDTCVETIYVVGAGGKESLGMIWTRTRIDEAESEAEPAAENDAASEAPRSLSPMVDAHRKLAELAGDWTALVGMTMPGMPEMEPVPMAQTNAVVCGGMWLSNSAEGSFMGMPYQGYGLMGYDPDSKEYISLWVDNFSPKLLIYRGTSKDGGKTTLYRGASIGPTGQPTTTTSKVTIVDADTWTMFTESRDGAGENAGMMTMRHTRRK